MSIGQIGSKGETIVEVLIVMMVLGSVLTSAFVVVNKASNANEASQERSEASAYAQEQVERLKSYLAGTTGANPSGNFCMGIDNQPVNVPDITIGGCREIIHDRYAGYLSYDSSRETFNEKIVWASAAGGYDMLSTRYKVANE